MREKIRFERDGVVIALNPDEYWFLRGSTMYPLAIRGPENFEQAFLTSRQAADSLNSALLAAEKAAKAAGSYWSIPRFPKHGAAAEADVDFPDIDGGKGEDGRKASIPFRFSSRGAVLTLTPEQFRLVRATMSYTLVDIGDNDFSLMLMSTRYYAERVVSAIEAAEADAARRGFVFG